MGQSVQWTLASGNESCDDVCGGHELCDESAWPDYYTYAAGLNWKWNADYQPGFKYVENYTWLPSEEPAWAPEVGCSDYEVTPNKDKTHAYKAASAYRPPCMYETNFCRIVFPL